MFYGLPVSTYVMDSQQHNSAHLHVRYQDFRAMFGIEHDIVVWDEETDLSPDSLYLLGQPIH